jgi:hypothetical protein
MVVGLECSSDVVIIYWQKHGARLEAVFRGFEDGCRCRIGVTDKPIINAATSVGECGHSVGISNRICLLVVACSHLSSSKLYRDGTRHPA